MFWRFVLLLCLLISVSGCKGYREFKEARKALKITKAERKNAFATNHDSIPKITETDVLFKMKRGYCFGTCRVFELVIYKDFSAIYNGIANVQMLGNYKTKYAHQLSDSILIAADKLGFVLLLDNYDNQFITDLPTTNYTLALNGLQKNILCRVDCPESLVQFGLRVESWIDTCSWEKAGDK